MSDSLRPHGAHQAPLSVGFPRQEYWRGLPFLLQGIFLSQGRTHVSSIAGGLFIAETPGQCSAKSTLSKIPLGINIGISKPFIYTVTAALTS